MLNHLANKNVKRDKNKYEINQIKSKVRKMIKEKLQHKASTSASRLFRDYS